jgi:hypothetical protein
MVVDDSLLLYRRREVLQQLGNAILQVLQILLFVAVGADRLGRPALPDLLLAGHRVYVKNQGAVVDGRAGSGSHASKTEAAHAVGVPLPLLLDGYLVANQQIGLRLRSDLGEPFLNQIRLNILLDFGVQDAAGVGVAAVRPLVGMEAGEIRVRKGIPRDILGHSEAAQEKQGEAKAPRRVNRVPECFDVHFDFLNLG